MVSAKFPRRHFLAAALCLVPALTPPSGLLPLLSSHCVRSPSDNISVSHLLLSTVSFWWYLLPIAVAEFKECRYRASICSTSHDSAAVLRRFLKPGSLVFLTSALHSLRKLSQPETRPSSSKAVFEITSSDWSS